MGNHIQADIDSHECYPGADHIRRTGNTYSGIITNN